MYKENVETWNGSRRGQCRLLREEDLRHLHKSASIVKRVTDGGHDGLDKQLGWKENNAFRRTTEAPFNGARWQFEKKKWGHYIKTGHGRRIKRTDVRWMEKCHSLVWWWASFTAMLLFWFLLGSLLMNQRVYWCKICRLNCCVVRNKPPYPWPRCAKWRVFSAKSRNEHSNITNRLTVVEHKNLLLLVSIMLPVSVLLTDHHPQHKYVCKLNIIQFASS